ESTLEDEKTIEKVGKFRSYIVNHWGYISDWRKRVDDEPKEWRVLGAMKGHQSSVCFGMKKRGMQRRKADAEAKVKEKQGNANNTLKEVYLASQHRSHRKQREVKKAVRMSEYLRQPIRPSIGVKQGSISLYSAHSSAMGRLFKILN